MKRICMLVIGATFTLYSYGQPTRQDVEKQIKDPERKANAGKADVINARNKKIYDSTTFNNNTTDPVTIKTAKANTRRKHCSNKTRK